MSHTPEPWYAQGPLTDEESFKPGGTPPTIVVPDDDATCDPEGIPPSPVFVAEFDSERNRDRAVQCVNACAGMADPAAEIARLRAEALALHGLLDEADGKINAAENLLAVIHRDGGHYSGQHGTVKACDDARAIVCDLRRDLDKAQYDQQQAEARVKELEADRERLDYLDEKGERIGGGASVDRGSFAIWRWSLETEAKLRERPTLRAAINAARKPGGGS